MQKESVFIEGQIETTTLPMPITTSKTTSEVLVRPFFSLPQSKQHNEALSGGDEWFCQSEEDPWHISNVESTPHMTDLWASTTGTDIWEMADHHDPFSVYDSKTASLEFQPVLENDSSLTSSAHGHTTVSKAFLATECPDELLSDSTDSDSCSDYTVHSSSDNDDDSDWEDVREDSGAPRFQFADPVAEMLDAAVHNGALPREHIFYKLVSGALEYVLYDHSRGEKYKWDPTLVRWARSLLRLGRSRTFNFLRGPGAFNASKEKKSTSQVLALILAVLEFLCQANARCVAPNLAILQQVALLETSSYRF